MTGERNTGGKRKPFDYLETEPSANAPVSDNPSGLYCPDCRRAGMAHCSSPEYCGGMKLMRPRRALSTPTGDAKP